MRTSLCAVYILTNQNHTVLYTGVTSDLSTRIHEHRQGHFPSSFSRRYNLDVLVYFETTADVRSAIAREKQIKGWLRRKKIALIEKANPEWRDLASNWVL